MTFNERDRTVIGEGMILGVPFMVIQALVSKNIYQAFVVWLVAWFLFVIIRNSRYIAHNRNSTQGDDKR